MTPLERRCRMLLFGYPVGYRRDRGEEIIGTLLDATPGSRAWPLPRDVLAIVVAGLRARYRLNRHRKTAANLRIAVIVGISAYLCLDAATWFHTTHVAKLCTAPVSCSQFAGPPWLGPALIAATVVLACVCPWRAIILCAALPAAVLVWLAAGGVPYILGVPEVLLPCLALLVILAGRRERPGSGWLWLLAAIAVSPWLIGVEAGPDESLKIFAAFALFSIAWIIVDAKPAIAVAVFLVAVWLSWTLYHPARFDVRPLEIDGAIVLGTVAVVGGLALWGLRRQSAR
jgi:hypothetical protein